MRCRRNAKGRTLKGREIAAGRAMSGAGKRWGMAASLLLLAACQTGTAPDPAPDPGGERGQGYSVHFPDNQAPAKDSIARPAPFVMPAPAWVADSADILSPEIEAALIADLQALEQRTGHQMVVVTVPSLGGKDVSDAGREIGICWKVGRKDHDDGTVLLVAPVERKLRIALGYGLEASIPDARAKAIIDTDIVPHFRKTAYDAGVKAGVAALIAELNRVPRDTRKASAAAKSRHAQTPDVGNCPAF